LRLEDDEKLQNALQNFRENAEEIPVEDILDFTPNQKRLLLVTTQVPIYSEL